MNIGVITYTKCHKTLLLNWNFNIAEVRNSILYEKDFVRFEIFDKNNNLLLSTHYPNVAYKGVYITMVKIEKEKEITQITHNIFRSPCTIRKVKVRWNVKGTKFRNKKRAVEYVYWKNRRASLQIEGFVDRR